MKVLLQPALAEYEVKGSRFIAELLAVSTQDAARDFLKQQKLRYSDATHVVHAFVLGNTGGILGCSDDGEPSGTSGRPALEVLKGSGITNVMLTVTRYFGGTKLGTGGLVKAYTEAAQRVLQVAQTEEYVPMIEFAVSLPYSCYEMGRRALMSVNAVVSGEEFKEGVTLKGRIRAEDASSAADLLRDLSRGEAQWVAG